MRIGEVAEKTGLSISNIRFYEKKGLIEPDREQESKYRDYTEEDIKRLKEIILYRKMDMSIETIYQLMTKEVSVQDVLEHQLQDLKEKQKTIQGAIDLCEKVIGDGNYKERDVEVYLNYVKEEEEKGKTFAKVDDLLMDFSEYTQFDRMGGDPYVGKFIRNPKINRVAAMLWMVMWIAVPVIAIADMCVDTKGISPVKLVFWIIWLVIVIGSFWKYRKTK